jgi:hypothetical protein
MPESTSDSSLDVRDLILVPALITLGITLLRLAGELMHGPARLFNSEPGGPGSIVGIIWLAPIFGIYFALKLAAHGQGPTSPGLAVGFALLGVIVVLAFSLVGVRLNVQHNFWGRLLYGWTVFVVAALVTFPGWRTLFRTLVAYAYAARVPVAVVMFFAFWRDWGTHYDAVPSDLPDGLGLMTKYLWLGFIPQLTFWVATTVLAGMLFGSLAAGIAHLGRRKPQIHPAGEKTP